MAQPTEKIALYIDSLDSEGNYNLVPYGTDAEVVKGYTDHWTVEGLQERIADIQRHKKELTLKKEYERALRLATLGLKNRIEIEKKPQQDKSEKEPGSPKVDTTTI